MISLTPRVLVRSITTALFISITALIWDGWWHVSIGRESLWIPPHLLLYLSTGVAVCLGLLGWHQNKAKVYKRLALVLLAIPASAPFDELWHRIFGVERLDSIWILWSPPHLLLIGVLLGSFLMLLPLLRKDTAGGQQLFGAMAVAGVTELLVVLVTPFFPTGPFELAGFWGAGIFAAALVVGLLFADRVISGPAPTVMVVLMLVLLHAIGVEGMRAPQVIVVPHAHAPSWLVVFSLIVPAMLIDMMRRLPPVMRGAAFGIVWAYILFTFSTMFFETAFRYPFSNIVTAVVAGYIGGGIGGYLSATVSDTIFRKK